MERWRRGAGNHNLSDHQPFSYYDQLQLLGAMLVERLGRTEIKLERIYPEAKGMNCLTIFTLVNDCVIFSKIRSIFLYEETNLLLSNDVNERKLMETSF